MKVYCTRPRQQHEAAHLTEISDENLSGSHSCDICGMPLILQGRYVPTEKLGEGGFGYTFLALDLNFGRKKRAIKQFREGILLPSEIVRAKKAFKRECEILDRLKHKQIPKIYELFDIQAPPDRRSDIVENQQAADYCYFVQEYIEGKDLARQLEDDGAFTEEEAKNFLHQMLGILKDIHNQSPSIIHRDIKPSNIIHTGDGKFHLIDFGISKQILPGVTTRSTQTETTSRTWGFAPPEQSDGVVNFSSDLYALGKTCICLLEGTKLPPNSWQPITKVSGRLVKILNRMTDKNPDRRYQSTTEIMVDLTKTKLRNIGWLKKMSIGSGIAISLLALPKIINIIFPQPIVTQFTPVRYDLLDDVPGVPSGKFTSCCSQTWIPLSNKVYKDIGHSFRKFQLESVSPNPGKIINSETGIEMLIDGEIDVALSSKPIEERLLKRAASKNIRLKETTIAIGNSILVVHPSLPIKEITDSQLVEIRNGEIINWKQLGGSDLLIHIYMTDCSYVIKNPHCTLIKDIPKVFREIAKNPGGLTIVPSNSITMQSKLKTLSINSVSFFGQKKALSTVEQDPILPSSLKVLFRSDDPKVGQAYITMLMTKQIQQSIEADGNYKLVKEK